MKTIAFVMAVVLGTCPAFWTQEPADPLEELVARVEAAEPGDTEAAEALMDWAADKGTPYAYEMSDRWPSDLEVFQGVWYDGEMQELLIISGDACRVVIPWLGYYGETAYAVRLRDRSDAGFCPALEVDVRESGIFFAPLTYYVSGVDETHFWSNTQAQRFEKIG